MISPHSNSAPKSLSPDPHTFTSQTILQVTNPSPGEWWVYYTLWNTSGRPLAPSWRPAWSADWFPLHQSCLSSAYTPLPSGGLASPATRVMPLSQNTSSERKVVRVHVTRCVHTCTGLCTAVPHQDFKASSLSFYPSSLLETSAISQLLLLFGNQLPTSVNHTPRFISYCQQVTLDTERRTQPFTVAPKTLFAPVLSWLFQLHLFPGCP